MLGEMLGFVIVIGLCSLPAGIIVLLNKRGKKND